MEKSKKPNDNVAVTLRTRIYCPNIQQFPLQIASERADDLVSAIDAAHAAGIEVFLAPEYYFTFHTASLPDPSICIAYNDSDAQIARNALLMCSARYPNMLIIAGSFFMIQGVANPHIFNTSFVYNAGRKLTEHSKHDVAGDATYAALCGLPFHPGDPGTAFDFRGVRCYLQICTDTTNAPDHNHQLSIVPAFLPGAAALYGMSKFDKRILSDGAGRYVYLYKNQAGKVLSQTGVGPIFDVDINF